jgi:hypothetical protein
MSAPSLFSSDATERIEADRFRPQRPTTIEETGLSRGLLGDLLLKRLYVEGATTLTRLSKDVKLDYSIIDTIYRWLLKEQLCESKGMHGEDFEIGLTSRGVRMAEEAFRRNQYSGPSPVPLEAYRDGVRRQAALPRVTRETLGRCLADLVVPETLTAELGTAMVSGGTVFLYGPTGNGKTSIAERLHHLYADSVYIPYAVEVSGYVINVFDPVIHQALPDDEGHDLRWVRAARPSVTVGGELQADMLEPSIDDITRLYRAPLQMKANNGMLIIDDFGRQKIPARDLLNRWIVPLDRRIDHLSLASGVTFEVPFEVTVVIATNLDPKDLAEEAFMRRMRNKVKIDSISPATLRTIWDRVCAHSNLAVSAETADYVVAECVRHARGGMLRACFAVDLVRILMAVAAFEERHAELTKADVDRAIRLYFAH